MGEADDRAPDDQEKVKAPSRLRTWAKRVGFVGIALFTLKGIVWLVVAATVAWGARR